MLETLLADETTGRVIRIALMVLSAVIVVWITQLVVARLTASIREEGGLGPSEGEKRLKTLGSIVRYAVIAVVTALLIAGILAEFGVAVGPFLGTLGIASVIVGFGAQNLVRDYINGLYLLLENHYGVEDWVRLVGVDGRVEKVTLRMTQLRDLEGNVHIVPHGEIKVVTNLTKEWTRVVVDVSVAYKEDVERVLTVLREVGDELEADSEWSEGILEPLAIRPVQSLGDSGVGIRLVYKVTPEQQWDLRRELQRRVKRHFDRHGIEIPFPHRTIYYGNKPAEG